MRIVFSFAYGIRQRGVGVIYSGITSVPNFVKIKQLVPKLKVGTHACLDSMVMSLIF